MLALVQVCMCLVYACCCACMVHWQRCLLLRLSFFFFFFCLHYFVYRAVQDQMTVSKYAIGETLQLFLKCCGRFSIQVFLLGSSIIIHHKRRLT